MNNTTRWEPMEDLITLRDAMNRLVQESVARARPFLPGYSGNTGFALDIYESDEAVIVEAELPGVKPEDVDIAMSGDMLTIKAHRRQKEIQPERYLGQERHFGGLSRSVRLSSDLDPEQASAEFQDGVLVLTLPRREESKPKIIQIKPRAG